MRIIVLSDSHGNALVLPKIVRNQPDADMFVFLGDGENEYETLRKGFPDKVIRGVRGNCDWISQLPLIDMLVVKHKRIFYTHGHTYYVKRGISDLVDEARKNKANILLYGHTHIAASDYSSGMHILNPGSVSQPRAGKASYGLIDITDTGIFTRVVTV